MTSMAAIEVDQDEEDESNGEEPMVSDSDSFGNLQAIFDEVSLSH